MVKCTDQVICTVGWVSLRVSMAAKRQFRIVLLTATVKVMTKCACCVLDKLYAVLCECLSVLRRPPIMHGQA